MLELSFPEGKIGTTMMKERREAHRATGNVVSQRLAWIHR